MDDNDQQLWSRARAGDASAFGTLYERHARAVYAFCFWRTSDAALAEDLSAAVFLQVWASRGRTELTEPSLLPWLLGVAHNLVRNQWRSARRRRAALARLPPLRDSPDPVDEIADRIDAQRNMQAVRAALERLPRRERDVLEMCVWMGLSPAEAAAALRIPVGTVHSRLHRARTRLKKSLDEAPQRGGHEPGDGTALSRPALEVFDGT
ncbi:RNA polymerase sigma factor [Dactylosporangium roseum]|uniref:RNA polymerase sigma factor n=1 Tax=Dactylosporangium roseum TaxID=47989 RepID=A0ABY5Z930_9ACTN|nr:RNA polymerase sigma factor [Dactylosporangium roseum]UWZ37972.1 RNA polymerase sigma factor [Dactylosporangium roseum]